MSTTLTKKDLQKKIISKKRFSFFSSFCLCKRGAESGLCLHPQKKKNRKKMKISQLSFEKNDHLLLAYIKIIYFVVLREFDRELQVQYNYNYMYLYLSWYPSSRGFHCTSRKVGILAKPDSLST